VLRISICYFNRRRGESVFAAENLPKSVEIWRFDLSQTGSARAAKDVDPRDDAMQWVEKIKKFPQ